MYDLVNFRYTMNCKKLFSFDTNKSIQLGVEYSIIRFRPFLPLFQVNVISVSKAGLMYDAFGHMLLCAFGRVLNEKAKTCCL